MSETVTIVRRKYTAEERAQALTTLAACGGIVGEASRMTGVPARTLEHWRDRPASGAVRAQLAVREELLAQSMERLVWRLLRSSKGKLEGAKLPAVLNGLATVFDRWRLLRDKGGSPGGNAGANGGLDLSKLSTGELRTFLDLMAKAGGPDAQRMAADIARSEDTAVQHDAAVLGEDEARALLGDAATPHGAPDARPTAAPYGDSAILTQNDIMTDVRGTGVPGQGGGCGGPPVSGNPK